MNMKKGLTAFIPAAGLCLFLAAGTVFFDPAANAAPAHQTKLDTAADTYIVKAGELNVRKEPNKQGVIVGTLRSEDAVKVKQLEGADWAEIDYKGQKAYISTHFLMKQPMKAVTAKQTAFYTPTLETGKKSSVKAGETVNVLGWGFSHDGGFDRKWAYVTYGGKAGYVKTDDLAQK
ncbi:SH3 domain-containing protein [Bacillus amyloliquefaciens]|uniref:SH3 domain-containing protein n=1 Tax=Bacillus amyloliquefaciens TaxID=1390 RepID=UPI003C782BBC